MTILGYVFTFLNYLLYCASRFCKEKHQMLALDLLAKAAFIMGLACMGSLSGAFSMLVLSLALIFAFVKEKRNHRWGPLYVIFQILLIYVMMTGFDGVSSVFVFLSTSIALISVWWMPPQKMRIAGVAGNVFTLMYQISIQNWAGLCELIVMSSNLSAYVKYHKAVKYRYI